MEEPSKVEIITDEIEILKGRRKIDMKRAHLMQQCRLERKLVNWLYKKRTYARESLSEIIRRLLAVKY